MGIARRTVNTNRQNAYRLLKKLMGVRDDQLPLAATGMSNVTHTRMIPYPVIEAAVKLAARGKFSIQDAVNEVIRQLFGDQLV